MLNEISKKIPKLKHSNIIEIGMDIGGSLTKIAVS